MGKEGEGIRKGDERSGTEIQTVMKMLLDL